MSTAETRSSWIAPPPLLSPMTSKSCGIVGSTASILGSLRAPSAISGGVTEAVKNSLMAWARRSSVWPSGRCPRVPGPCGLLRRGESHKPSIRREEESVTRPSLVPSKSLAGSPTNTTTPPEGLSARSE
jgi:hypothetical protein